MEWMRPMRSASNIVKRAEILEVHPVIGGQRGGQQAVDVSVGAFELGVPGDHFGQLRLNVQSGGLLRGGLLFLFGHSRSRRLSPLG